MKCDLLVLLEGHGLEYDEPAFVPAVEHGVEEALPRAAAGAAPARHPHLELHRVRPRQHLAARRKDRINTAPLLTKDSEAAKCNAMRRWTLEGGRVPFAKGRARASNPAGVLKLRA